MFMGQEEDTCLLPQSAQNCADLGAMCASYKTYPENNHVSMSYYNTDEFHADILDFLLKTIPTPAPTASADVQVFLQ